MNGQILITIAVFLGTVSTVCAADRVPEGNARSLDRPFSLYTRVTDSTVAPIVQQAQQGDLFWGRPEEKIPRQYRAISVRSHDNLRRRLERTSLSEYAAVVLDGEYRDYDSAIQDVTRLRQAVDLHNKKHPKAKLRFIAFFHMRIIDAKPKIASLPDVVMIGKAYWDAANILGDAAERRRRSAPTYVQAIRKAGKTPAILLGSPDKETHDADSVSKTISIITASPQNGGLGIRDIGFFYPADKAGVLLGVLRRYNRS